MSPQARAQSRARLPWLLCGVCTGAILCSAVDRVKLHALATRYLRSLTLSGNLHTHFGKSLNRVQFNLGSKKGLEAAIGIEPMNKGFAVRRGPLSLGVMECHRPVFIDLFEELC